MFEQTILWRRVDLPGHDACSLRAAEGGWHLTGAAVFSLDGRPCRLLYNVECDDAWRARSASVTGAIGERAVQLEIVSLPGARWTLNGREQPQAQGCQDVDLNFTPATNLIAIRRLALRVSDRAEAPAAWLRFPELEVERLEQRYHRVAVDQYEYQAPGVDYASTLQVSEIGFVTRYPGLWEVETAEGPGLRLAD